jgi:hypothetical protein
MVLRGAPRTAMIGPVKRPVPRDRSLEELEGERWPEPPVGATRLVLTAHALRRRPLGELSVEELRLMISQGLGLRHLLPLAREILRADPMAAGDLYPGDLLAAVQRRDPSESPSRIGGQSDDNGGIACV